jgi:hypothetical protein
MKLHVYAFFWAISKSAERGSENQVKKMGRRGEK